MQQQLVFEKPTEHMEEEVLAFMQRFYDAGEAVVHGSGGLDVYKDYAKWMDYLRSIEAGETDVFLPSNIYLARTEDGAIVGILDIRPDLPEEKQHFGHMGYAVAPPFRRRGYAAEMVAYGVYRLRKAGRGDILACTAAENVASQKTLEKNGFVCFSRYADEDSGMEIWEYMKKRSGNDG